MEKLELEGYFGFCENPIDPNHPKAIGYSDKPDSEFEDYLSFYILQLQSMHDMWNNEYVSAKKKLRITVEVIDD